MIITHKAYNKSLLFAFIFSIFVKEWLSFKCVKNLKRVKFFEMSEK